MNKQIEELIDELAEEKFSTAEEEAVQGGIHINRDELRAETRKEAELFVHKVLAAAQR